MKIDRDYLRFNKHHVFVFGDNLLRVGKGGAAILRDEPNTYGFITKKEPNIKDSSYYRPEEYVPVFEEEIKKLIKEIKANPDKVYLISKLGGGLANKYQIFEKVVKPGLVALKAFTNVEFLC
jgi:hypothetical protein